MSGAGMLSGEGFREGVQKKQGLNSSSTKHAGSWRSSGMVGRSREKERA